jgi:hypothetical protein
MHARLSALEQTVADVRHAARSARLAPSALLRHL